MALFALKEYVPNKGGGDPTKIVRGTGLAQPRGVESFLNYDGFQLNNRKLLDAYIVTGIDGLADPDVRDSRDVNPGRHGETYYDAYYGGRTIVLTGKVRAHTIQKLRDMQEALRMAFADISQERRLIFGAEDPKNSVYLNCKKTGSIVMAEVQADFTYRRDFQITLRASNPRFLSYDQAWLNWEATAKMPVGTPLPVMSATNIGNYPAEPTIVITGPVEASYLGGPALTVTATQNVNGAVTRQSFTINAPATSTVAIADGSRMQLDTAARTLVLDGANAFSQLDVSSDWLELEPGETTFELTPYGPSQPIFNVRYRDTYL